MECDPHLFDCCYLWVSDISHHAHAQPPTTYVFVSAPQQAPWREQEHTHVMAMIISTDIVKHYKDMN